MNIVNHWRDPKYVLDFIKSLCFFNLAILVNYFAVRLATKNAGPALNDIFFNYLPHLDTSFIDANGAYFLYLLTFVLIIFYQKKANFLIRSLSVLILVRTFFINLTFLGIPEGVEQTRTFFTQGGDLFFSGHVALPFMVALVYWDNKILRSLYLGFTFVMATEVLLGRFHYSIDVFGALFITYGVYSFCKKYIVI